MDMSVDCKPGEAFNQVSFLCCLLTHGIFSVSRNGIGKVNIVNTQLNILLYVGS